MPVSILLSGHNSKSDTSNSKVTEAAKCDLRVPTSQSTASTSTKEKNTENVITKSLIPINFPLDLNLSLNCVLLQPPPNCSGSSAQNSPALSTPSNSTTSYSNSLSISSISSSSPISCTSSASASPSSCYSSSSGFCDGTNSKTCIASSTNAKKYRLSIVKIEEEQEGEEDRSLCGEDETLVQCVEKVQHCKKEKEEEENSTVTSSYCLSTTADCDWDLDFDDVDFDEYSYDITDRQTDEIDDDDVDTDVEVTSSCIVSPVSNNTNTTSDSNSSFSISTKSSACKKRKKHQTHSALNKQNTSKSDEEHSDESEYLSSENPSATPCIHCQDNKDHPIDESVIWPIQLDLDLVKTLVQLCPEFFGEFCDKEDEMDPTEQQPGSSTSASAESPMEDIQSPSTSTSATEEGTGTNSMSAMDADSSPPHVQVDDSPLQPSMDRNKESLKVKLLLRRPMNQLVEQGILPPPKTPPAYAGQRVRLIHQRTGDLLKAKIQQRPARQELIRQHILEDSNARVAPALAEKQRMLKKARLADSLNDHLIHRPGPLELVQKNILHAPDATIDQAIKEGAVCFKATSEGHIPGPQLPHSYLSEDDSSSDMSSPAGTPDQSQSSSSDSSKATDSNTSSAPSSLEQALPTTTTATFVSPPPVSILSPVPPPPPPMPIPIQKMTFAPTTAGATASTSNPQMQNQILSRIVQAAVTSSTVPPLTSAQLTLSKLSQLDQNQLSTLMNQNQGQRAFLVAQGINFNNPPAQQQHACASKSRSSKKSSKPKSQPKARQIKFHEYKGPPSAQKGQQQSQQNEVESSYELLLQQQQLFLQWQLEWQHKYPQIILPAVSKLQSPTEATAKLLSSITAAGATLSVHATPPPPVSAAAIASIPTVMSPSSISSVPNQNQNILPQPQIMTANPPSFIQPEIKVAQGAGTQVPPSNNSNANSNQVQPVPVTFAPVSTPPHVPMAPKRTESSPNIAVKMESSAEKSSPVVSTSNCLIKTKSLSKLTEWKVNDLKAELKKRNLPVSGSKPQLIERLKSADLSLQDESISTTTHNTASKVIPANNPGIVVKTEIQAEEPVATCYEMMDVSDTQPQEQTKAGGSEPKVRSVKMDIKPVSNGGSQLTANAAIMALLQNNNIKLNPDGTLPAYVLNALASVIKKPDPKPGAASDKDSSANPAQNIVFVDESIIREQRKHIEQLQEALKNSQQQLLEMKSQQGGGQKHRLALQQHLQHKMQQQALQAQLQKLQIQLQLHSLQQQQQQQNQSQSKQPTKVQLSQVSTKIQPQFPHIQIVSQHPQKAVPGSQVGNQFILPKSAGVTQNKLATSVNSENHKNIPYAIVKIATNATTHQTPEKKLSDIPQIIIPDGKDASFQVGKNDSNQGSNTIPVPQVPADQSWLLKINDLKEDSKDSSKELANFFDSVIGSNASGIKLKQGNNLQELQVKPGSSDAKSKKKSNVKSQMVDDVLEILIRHGELPPSAAQEPPTPTTPGKSPSILTYPITSSDGHGYVPPPPPLPPATFAVTLPTSISFPKPSTASVFSGHPITSSPSATADISTTSRGAPTSAIPTEVLSKEAQDILKISEDLSNFGKAHAENENRVLSPFMFSNIKSSQNVTKSPNHMSTDEDNLSMLLGEVEKDLHLVDDMDVVLDDHSTHGLHLAQTSFQNPTNHHIPGSTLQDHNLNHQLLQNYANQRQAPALYNISTDGLRASEEFLEELGTLLPDDIDVTMPMEMDYSEWLEDLLPTDNNNTVPTSFNGDSLHLALSPFANSTEFGVGTEAISGNSNLFGNTAMDFNTSNNNASSSNQQRDPLLSSRSLNIFSSIPSTSGTSCANSTLNALNNAIDVKSGTNRAPSPMAMGNDSLLWDFA